MTEDQIALCEAKGYMVSDGMVELPNFIVRYEEEDGVFWVYEQTGEFQYESIDAFGTFEPALARAENYEINETGTRFW